MKLATYLDPDARTGIVIGDMIVDSGFDGTMIDLIAGWDEARPQLERRARSAAGKAIASVKLCAPVLKPAKIWAIGLNYADHIAESGYAAARATSLVHQGADVDQRTVRSDHDR